MNSFCSTRMPRYALSSFFHRTTSNTLHGPDREDTTEKIIHGKSRYRKVAIFDKKLLIAS